MPIFFGQHNNAMPVVNKAVLLWRFEEVTPNGVLQSLACTCAALYMQVTP